MAKSVASVSLPTQIAKNARSSSQERWARQTDMCQRRAIIQPAEIGRLYLRLISASFEVLQWHERSLWLSAGAKGQMRPNCLALCPMCAWSRKYEPKVHAFRFSRQSGNIVSLFWMFVSHWAHGPWPDAVNASACRFTLSSSPLLRRAVTLRFLMA